MMDAEVRRPATDGIEQAPARTINHELNTRTMDAIREATTESEDGLIPFSHYMDIALYGPDGYYSGGKADIRSTTGAGDFRTWPMEATDFGEAMGVVVNKLWVAMDKPSKVTVIESGAGNGVMMKDILAWARQERPQLYEAANFHIIEPGDMEMRQRRTVYGRNDPTKTPRRGSRAETSSVDDHRRDFRKVQWHRDSAISAEIGQGDATIFLSNELPDAFPVEIVRSENGTLQQKFVGVDGDQLIEAWKPLQQPVQEYLREFSVDVHDGHEVPVNLNAVKWQRNLNGLLRRGGIVTVDYGEDGARQIATDPELAPQRSGLAGILGALPGAIPAPTSAVRTSPRGFNTLAVPGELDLTSNVDFRMLAKVAMQGGLNVAFSGTQADFLLACGVPASERICVQSDITADRLSEKEWDQMQIRMAATRAMLMPNGFRALVLTRNVSVDFGTNEPLLSAYDGIIPAL